MRSVKSLREEAPAADAVQNCLENIARHPEYTFNVAIFIDKTIHEVHAVEPSLEVIEEALFVGDTNVISFIT